MKSKVGHQINSRSRSLTLNYYQSKLYKVCVKKVGDRGKARLIAKCYVLANDSY